MIVAQAERDGKTSLARRYYLSSVPLTAAAVAASVRAHSGIENRRHGVMDVVFHDDLMRLRTGSGPSAMADHPPRRPQHRQDTRQASLKVRRKPSDGTTTNFTPHSLNRANDLQAILLGHTD